MKTNGSRQILSALLCLAMLLTFIPITAQAAADNVPYAPEIIQEVVWSRYCIFANGTPITIEAAGSGTAVWYMDGDTKKYVNPNGANGDDLSEWIIFGGSKNPDGINFDTYVTMTGGTVKRIYAGIYSMGYLNGTAYVTVTGGTITGGIFCDTYLSSTQDKTKTVTIFDSTGASINLGRYGVADNVVQKNDSAWAVSGNGIIPEGVTLTVPEGETLTVPSDATLTNNGALANGGGTITVYGKLLGNAPENYIAPQEFTFNTAELKVNVPHTMSEAVCTTDNTTLSPWFTYEIENPGTTEAVLSGREITAKNEGTVTVKVTMHDGYCEPVSKTFDFSVSPDIVKTDQAAPTVGKTDETISAKKDGKITGVDSTMEYRKDGESTYTAITGTEVTGLGSGRYFVRYKETDKFNASPETEVTVAAGRKLTVKVPQNQVGYTLTTTTPEVDYFGSIYVEFQLHNGYSMTDDFQINNGTEPMWQHFNQQTGVLQLRFVGNDFDFTVNGVADTTPPTAEISLKENKWTSFWKDLTFSLFFKDSQNVTITANDVGDGVNTIQYYLAGGELNETELKEITDWQTYNGMFQIDPDNKYVVYVKIADNAGNVTYINSDGIVLDATAPVLYGLEDGGVYHDDKIFKVIDDHFLKIEVDGVDITDTAEGGKFKIVADNAEHTVTATDKVGNVTEHKITVYKKYMVTFTDGDGGSYEKKFKYGEVITIPANEFFEDTFRKTGYALTGWQGYTEGMIMPLNDLTFTAVYSPNQYTVRFDTNGGETIDPITVTFDEKYGNLPSSAVAGLSGGNKNWYLVDAAGNVTETNIKKLTLVGTARDHKLFIKRNVLAPSISVALTVPGGISDGYQYYIPGASNRVLTATIGNMNTDLLDYTYKWYKDGTPIEGETFNVLTLDGNVSDSGTYKVEVTATLKVGANVVVTSDTATASKEQKVKILHATNTLSYDANGGEGGPQSSYTGGTSLNVSKDEPTKEHYNFIGWNTAPDGTGSRYKAGDAYTFANDNGNGGCEATLYAQWKLVEYTVTYVADGKSVSTEMVGHGKDATLPDVPAKIGYVGKWDSGGKNITKDTTINVIYTEMPAVKPDDVKPEDKTHLEDAKAKLEEMLGDDSYAANEKNAIEDEIKRIDDALKSIENAAAVDKLLEALPESITLQNKADEAIVQMAKDAYEKLSDHEKELLDEQHKEKLEQLVAIIAAGCKGTDTCPSLSFRDIDVKTWYHHDVDYVIANGYMIGYPNRTFAPDNAITRAEAVQVLYNLEGRPSVCGRDAFCDTTDNAWYSEAILWASQEGLIVGYGNGNFGPEDLITCEQMISILWRYAKNKGVDVSTDKSATLIGFDDAETVSGWAMSAMKWATETKIIRGIPVGDKVNLAAGDSMTRARAAAILRRFDKI